MHARGSGGPIEPCPPLGTDDVRWRRGMKRIATMSKNSMDALSDTDCRDPRRVLRSLAHARSVGAAACSPPRCETFSSRPAFRAACACTEAEDPYASIDRPPQPPPLRRPA